jgi:hypothetical protein
MTDSVADEREKAYGEIWLGDLLHALAATRAGNAETALVWAVEMLDLPTSLTNFLEEETRSGGVSDEPWHPEFAAQKTDSGLHPPEIKQADLPTDEPLPYGIVKTRRVEVHNQQPEWLESAPAIPEVTDAQIEWRPHLDPLFHTNTARALISTAFATRRDEGAIDFLKLLARISKQYPITELPRLPVSTLRFGVQLLIDRGQGTWPFYGDQELIRKEILGVVGRDRVETLYFSDSPLRGLGPGSRRTWKLPYEPPSAGTPVVVLTDLGIARRRNPDLGAPEAEWLDFALTVCDARCPLLALVPYAAQRWPVLLREAMYLISWDRPTTVSVVRRMVGHGLEVVTGP